MSAHLPPDAGFPAFEELERELSLFSWRPEVSVEQVPSPQRIAPHSLAVEADVVLGDEELGTGRLVLLHDPAGVDVWQGFHRCVTFARAEVDMSMASDPLLAEVGWSWLTEALDNNAAEYVAPSGTVTAVASRSFGEMRDEPDRAEVEIRASWTPVLAPGRGIGAHLAAWQELLCTTAGLPSLPEGVVLLGARAGRGR